MATVGLANSMAYDSKTVLTPSENLFSAKKYKNFPYEEDIFVDELKLVNYGLTFAIKSSVIWDFINEELDRLRLAGFGTIPGFD